MREVVCLHDLPRDRARGLQFPPSPEKEEDLLDKAWGLEPNSRLSCQAKVAESDLTVEIPKYTINHAKENH